MKQKTGYAPKTKYTMSFEDWIAKVHEIATKADYELKGGYMLAPEVAWWREQYENGLTPLKAWNRA